MFCVVPEALASPQLALLSTTSFMTVYLLIKSLKFTCIYVSVYLYVRVSIYFLARPFWYTRIICKRFHVCLIMCGNKNKEHI